MRQNTYQNHKVIVLDNDSSDGSVEAIQAEFPKVEIIELTDNRGYAGNNNVGIEAAMEQGADWVFILNEDTVLASDCLAKLVEVGESDQRIGIVGPMVYHHDEPDIIQSAGGQLSRNWTSWHLDQDEPDRGQYVEPHLVDYITGCGILVRRALIDHVGMIDERFYYYVEETEWCLRSRKNGWRVMHVPEAKMWHKGVQREHRPKPYVTYYATRNRFLMLAKHQASLGDWFVVWAQTLRTLASWTIKPKWRSMREHRNAMWQGMIDFLRHRWGQMPS